MVVKLYYMDLSPPCRSVLLTIKALNLSNVEYKVIDLIKGEQMAPEFLKLNPQHTVPVIEDGDLVIAESHAIVAYLAAKYGNDDSLYPKNLDRRALVDQKLHFDNGVLFPRLINIIYPALFQGMTKIPQEKKDDIVKAYNFLEEFLKRSTYLAGEHLTIADLCVVTTVASLNIFVKMTDKEFPHLTRWYSEMKKLPYYGEANQVGFDKHAAFVKSKLTGETF